jgi:hypothetical protein
VLVFPLAVYVVVSALMDVVRALRARMRGAGEPLPAAARWLVTAGRRRLGAQAVHVGAALMLAGFAGASYQQTAQAELEPAATGGNPSAATLTVGGYRLTYLGARDNATAEYDETQAVVRVDEPDGTAYLALPSLRRYRSGKVRETAEVAIRAGVLEDLYVEVRQFLGTDAAPSAYVRAHVNPLTFFVWAGALVLMAGTLAGLWPTRGDGRSKPSTGRRGGPVFFGSAAAMVAVVALWKGAAPAALAATGAVLLAALWEGGRAAWGWAAAERAAGDGTPGSNGAAPGNGEAGGPVETKAGAADDAAVDRLLGRWEEP